MRMAVGDSLVRMFVRVPSARVEAGQIIMGVIVMPVIMGVLVHMG